MKLKKKNNNAVCLDKPGISTVMLLSLAALAKAQKGKELVIVGGKDLKMAEMQ